MSKIKVAPGRLGECAVGLSYSSIWDLITAMEDADACSRNLLVRQIAAAFLLFKVGPSPLTWQFNLYHLLFIKSLNTWEYPCMQLLTAPCI